MTPWIEINGRRVGPGYPVYIIAEMSGNHGQSLEQAREIVRAAKACGADAVKLQTYTPDTLTIDCDNDYFRIEGTLWHGRTLYELYGEAFTRWDWQPQLMQLARDLGIDMFSSPFDDSAVDFLAALEVPAYKIASFENCDLALLRKVAATGKPIIASTGMATLAEIHELVETVRQGGGKELALLKCTSAYPAPLAAMNLRTIPHLAEGFGVPVGLSDHTLGIAAPVAAVALGACIVEKHFTLSRSLPGPDSAFSLEPDEFKAMAENIRAVEKALGNVDYELTAAEAKSRVFRRSLFVVAEVRAGELFTPRNVRSIRPGYGLHPRHLDDVLGRAASRQIPRGTPLNWTLIGALEADRHERRSGEGAHASR